MFALDLRRADLIRLRDQYLKNSNEFSREQAAFAGGIRIAAGEYGREPLNPILRWKSQRPKALQASNMDADIADALGLATSAKTDRAAMSVLCGLRGVKVPVASAILTAIYPERFTVIDFRALETLGIINLAAPSIDQYLEYLTFCRAAAVTVSMRLRDLDRALWQKSKNDEG